MVVTPVPGGSSSWPSVMDVPNVVPRMTVMNGISKREKVVCMFILLASSAKSAPFDSIFLPDVGMISRDDDDDHLILTRSNYK